jgi:hypothetical protein
MVMRTRSTGAAAVIAVTLALPGALSPAVAECRDDLVSVSQTVERTRAELQGAAAAAKCAAYRQHVAALAQVRDVFARCDSGANKGKNAAQVKATIADVTKQMRASCKK